MTGLKPIKRSEGESPMQAMQYEITLPADYDMGIIHRRVAEKGRLTDEFPGLAMKAYLVRERGVAGSPVNQYAPFYLWNTATGMNAFLWGPGFRGSARTSGARWCAAGWGWPISAGRGSTPPRPPPCAGCCRSRAMPIRRN